METRNFFILNPETTSENDICNSLNLLIPMTTLRETVDVNIFNEEFVNKMNQDDKVKLSSDRKVDPSCL